MFFFCSSLISLDLSNFDTSKLTDITTIFYGCESLQYINLEKYNELQNLDMDDILYLVPENIIICLNEENNILQIKEKIKEKNYYNIYCGNDWKCHQKKFIAENNACMDYDSQF